MNLESIKYSNFLLVLILMAFTTVSCKKDKENMLPVITVLSPLENSSYEIPDIIPIYAEIEDDELIQSISVVLVDENLKPVMDSKSYFPNSKTYSLIDDYHISDLSLNSGDYYLKIRANDDQSFKNEYVQIYLEGIPRFLDQVIVLTTTGNNNIKVSGIENFNVASELFFIEGDYSASEVSSEHQKLFISGIEKINLQAYDFTNLVLSWEKEVIPYWPMHNAGCLYFDDILYVSYDYRDIFGYDFNGVDKYNSKVGDYDSPGRVFKHNDFILCDIQKKNGSEPHISTFYSASGVEAQRTITSFEVLDFNSKDGDIVTIVGNSNNIGYIGEYNITNNSLTNQLFADTLFLSCVGINTNTIYISTPAYIAEYSSMQNTLIPILNEPDIKHLVYEELSDLLLAANDTELLILSLPELTNQKTIEFSDLILDIHLLYSK